MLPLFSSRSYSGETRKEEGPTALRHKVSKYESPDKLLSPRLLNPKYNIAALHEWISYLEKEREKDRDLERFKLEMKDKENQRRYNLEVLRYKHQAQSHHTQSSEDVPQVETSQISYYINPPSKEQDIDSPAIDYLLDNNNVGTAYRDPE